MSDKEEVKYHCNFCNTDWKQLVGTTDTGGKHSRVSSQAVCPKCGACTKTWK